MKEILKFLLQYPEIVLIGAAVFTFVATQLLKMPIKHFTKRIKDEDTRKKVNVVILLLPFLLGCLYELLYSQCYLHTDFSVIEGLQFGTCGVSVYAFVENFLKKKGVTQTTITNEYKTTEGQAVVELVKEVTADGKIDGDDMTAVQKFLNKVVK